MTKAEETMVRAMLGNKQKQVNGDMARAYLTIALAEVDRLRAENAKLKSGT